MGGEGSDQLVLRIEGARAVFSAIITLATSTAVITWAAASSKSFNWSAWCTIENKSLFEITYI